MTGIWREELGTWVWGLEDDERSCLGIVHVVIVSSPSA